jgi:hypothetical protein
MQRRRHKDAGVLFSVMCEEQESAHRIRIKEQEQGEQSCQENRD